MWVIATLAKHHKIDKKILTRLCLGGNGIKELQSIVLENLHAALTNPPRWAMWPLCTGPDVGS
jgi:hypothetical protein